MTSASIAQRTAPPAITRQERRKASFGALVWDYMTTTDHKKIGRLYFGTSLFFFVFGGILALLIRAELAYPGMQFMHQETFNQLFTMHGTIMLLLFATPAFAAWGPTTSICTRSIAGTIRRRSRRRWKRSTTW